MRVVSMVPSWTETLIQAGVQVVGRTRFCIHPAEQVSTIPVVGGTKEVAWDLVQDLRPDLVLLDQEENPLSMAEECPVPYLATHVTSLETLQFELARLGELFRNAALMELAVDCLDIVEAPVAVWDSRQIPGLVQMIRTPAQPSSEVVYLIWKKPWMAASSETFIGSVLKKLGAPMRSFSEGEKYPVLEMEDFQNCFCLFSTEPFPFAKKTDELKATNLAGAIVDGEFYSWFGTRSIAHLKRALLQKST